MSFKDHFSDDSAAYTAYRPTYPGKLAHMLADLAPGRDLAFDAGCGTGQLSVPLADRFARVAALDASAQQIAAAAPHPRIAYRVAPADRSGLADRSVDLVTVAQAAHWFDLPTFYAEVRRIARPGAAIALASYPLPRIADDAVDAVLRRFYGETLGPYWPPERVHVERGYADLPFPFAPLPAPALTIVRDWRRADLVAFVGTWSAVRAMGAAGPAALAAFDDELADVWGGSDTLAIEWPVVLRIGRID